MFLMVNNGKIERDKIRRNCINLISLKEIKLKIIVVLY
jgi:hypothetical protein